MNSSLKSFVYKRAMYLMIDNKLPPLSFFFETPSKELIYKHSIEFRSEGIASSAMRYCGDRTADDAIPSVRIPDEPSSKAKRKQIPMIFVLDIVDHSI